MDLNADLGGDVLTLRPARRDDLSRGLLPTDHERVERIAKMLSLVSPIPPTQPADAPASWDASTAELIGWFQANRDRLPVEPFCLWPGAWVVDAALFYRSLDGDIATGPDGPRGRYGGLAHDLKCLRKATCLSEPQCR